MKFYGTKLSWGDRLWLKSGDGGRLGEWAKFSPLGGPPSPPRKKPWCDDDSIINNLICPCFDQLQQQLWLSLEWIHIIRQSNFLRMYTYTSMQSLPVLLLAQLFVGPRNHSRLGASHTVMQEKWATWNGQGMMQNVAMLSTSVPCTGMQIALHFSTRR